MSNNIENYQEIMPSVIDIPYQITAIPDPYDCKIEEYYHSPEKMKSILVLKKENELVDFIIEYKKGRNEEYKEFIKKKRIIEIKIKDIEKEFDKGILDDENYLKLIKNEINYENELVNIAEVDNTMENKSEVINRIQKRIHLLEDEINEVKKGKDQKQTSDIDIKLDMGHDEIPHDHVIKNEKSTDIKFQSSTGKLLNLRKINLENENEFLEKLLSLKEEYEEATNYFKNLGFYNQAQDALTNTEILQKIITKIENNQMSLNEIEHVLIPDAITPEYITGYTKEARKNIFAKIVKSLIEKRQEYIVEYFRQKEKLDAIKASVSSFPQQKQEIQNILEKIELKFYECVKNLHNLNEMQDDQWTPPPLIKYIEDFKSLEKINEDIPSFCVSISIGDLKYKSSDVYFQIFFRYSNFHVLDEYINQTGDNKFDYNVMLRLYKHDYFNITDKSIYLILYKNKSCWCPCCCIFGNNFVGDLEIKLNGLKNKSEITGNFEINLMENIGRSEYEQPFLNSNIYVTVRIRKALVEKEFKTIVTNTLEVVKFLPPFKGIGKYFHPDFRSSFIIDFDEKDLKKLHEKEIAIIIPKDLPQRSQLIIDPNEFFEKELDNPDCIENLNSIYVLIEKIKYYKSKLKFFQNEYEIDFLNEIISKIKAKFWNLQNQISSGIINLDTYILILNNQIQHDSKLMKYLDNLNEKYKAKLVADRIIILSKEISEAVQYFKTMF